jgi:hypothetical protein
MRLKALPPPPLHWFWMFVLAAWLLTRRDGGIWADGVLYAAQALSHLAPGVYGHDLFFAYGSQDDYTLFSPFYAHLIADWGLTQGTRIAQGIGLLLWLGGAALLAWRLPRWPAALALLAVVIYPPQYGAYLVVSYGEPYLTARLYAEAFSLMGMAAWLSGRMLLGGLAFLLAFAMHPLMALPAVLIGLAVVVRWRVWWAVLAAGPALALVLGGLGVSPFTGLLVPMDADWWTFSVQRSPFVFLHTWSWSGFSQAILVAVVAWTAWLDLPDGAWRRLARALSIVVPGALLLAWLGASVLHLPLIAGLQLSRVLWIGQILALMFIVLLVWQSLPGDRVWRRWRAVGLASLLMLDVTAQGVAALGLIVLTLAGQRYQPDYRPGQVVRILLLVSVLQVAAWSVFTNHIDSVLRAAYTERPAGSPFMSYQYLVAGMLLLLAWVSGLGDRGRLLAWGFSLACLLIALRVWPQEAGGPRYDSPARQVAIAPIQEVIPPGATVYWPVEPKLAWFWLRRANYLSTLQTAGSVFSADTTHEALRRIAHVEPTGLADAARAWGDQFSAKYSRTATPASIRHLCEDPLIDFMIVRDDGGQTAKIRFVDPETGYRYAVHACVDIRKLPRAAPSERRLPAAKPS